MSLSCSCDTSDDFAWYYHHPTNYSVLDTPKRVRCSSCDDLIAIGATVAKFLRSRPPHDDIEQKIHGDDWDAVPLKPYYLCERCADLYFSLVELGYECVSPDDNMLDLVAEYAELHGSQREVE